LKAFDIQTGSGFITTAIVNAHFLRREIANMIRFVTAAFGGDVDEGFVKVREVF